MHKCFLILFQRRKTKNKLLSFYQKNSLRPETGFLHPWVMFFEHVACLAPQKIDCQYFLICHIKNW